MLKDPQKNFYDVKRPFQGHDDPGINHPDPKAQATSMPMGQIVFGLATIVFVVAIAWLNMYRVKHENDAPSAKPEAAQPAAAQPATAQPAAPAPAAK